MIASEYIDVAKDACLYSFQFPPGGEGDSHMKLTGMLVVSLRGVNCRFWSRLGFPGRKAKIFTHTGIA